MRGKIRFSRWLMAATVLTVAEFNGAAPLATTSRAAAQAQSSGDFFRFDLPRQRSDRYLQNIFGPPIGGGSNDANQVTTRSHRGVRRNQNLRRTSPRLRKSLPHTVSGPRLPPSKTCRCRDRARHPGRSRTPLPKRLVPTSILPMSPAHQVIATSDLPRSPLSSCCQGSSAQVIVAVAIWLD